MKNKKGFTLIELLIVIAILAILAAIIYVAVDPAKRLSDSRDARRFSEVNSVLNAVLKYTVDQGGTLPTSIDSDVATVQMIGKNTSAVLCSALICTGVTFPATGCFISDFDTVLVDAYLADVPEDPSTGDRDEESRYYLNKSAAGRINIGACDGENQTISVQR